MNVYRAQLHSCLLSMYMYAAQCAKSHKKQIYQVKNNFHWAFNSLPSAHSHKKGESALLWLGT